MAIRFQVAFVRFFGSHSRGDETWEWPGTPDFRNRGNKVIKTILVPVGWLISLNHAIRPWIENCLFRVPGFKNKRKLVANESNVMEVVFRCCSFLGKGVTFFHFFVSPLVFPGHRRVLAKDCSAMSWRWHLLLDFQTSYTPVELTVWMES